MERAQLERWLEEGRSLDQIAELVSRHPSTVSYWLKKHGLMANGHGKHKPKGGLDKDKLMVLIERGLTLEEIAGRLGRSARTIRYWIDRLELPKPRDRRGATKEELAIPGEDGR